MAKEWTLTQEAFDRLLQWLDPNHEQAGREYEKIRRKLIKIFICRGCAEAEDLADETINRVARKVCEIADSYVGDPTLYFIGVARKVHLESVKPHAFALLPQPEPASEQAYECLERCLGRLTDQNRDLILQYYHQEKHAKIEHRKQLADRLGIAPNALRIRLHRIRAMLQQCVNDCIEQVATV